MLGRKTISILIAALCATAFGQGEFDGKPWRDNLPPEVTVLTPDETADRLTDVGEFSRDVLEDPWDFEQLSDGFLYQNMTDVTINDGVLTATATSGDPYFWLLYQGYNSAQNLGKLGYVYPIDPGRYMLASWRMYLDAPSYCHIYYYRGVMGSDTLTFAATEAIPVEAGWHIYQVRLDSLDVSVSQGLGPWNTCDVVHGLRFDPTTFTGSSIMIDWFRLGESGTLSTQVDVSWIVIDDQQSAEVEVFFDLEPTGFGGDCVWGPVPATGSVQSFPWCTAYIPYPGGFIYVSADDGVNDPVRLYAPGPILINDPPLLLVRDPDELGKEEFALEVQGNSWDMDGWNDIKMLHDVGNGEFIDSVFWGLATTDDSQGYGPTD